MAGRRPTRPLAALPLLVALAACGEATATPSASAPPLALPLATLPPPPWLDETRAREIYLALQRPEPRMGYDPLALLVLLPDRRYLLKWPEHPHGRVAIVTNNRGFRELEPTRTEKAGRRVLVLGDSQTEGVVYAQESFANVLEGLLGAAGHPAEVLNAGVGTTSPLNYLGQFLRNADLRPDLVVAVVYTGNDFAGSLQLDELVRGLPATPQPEARVREARERWPEILPQAFGQPLILDANPGAEAASLAVVREVLVELQRQCRHVGARLLVATLPTKPDIDEDDRERQDELLASLGLARADLEVNVRLGARLREELAALDIETLDLTELLQTAHGPAFWVRDYHLSVEGNARVALALARYLVQGR